MILTVKINEIDRSNLINWKSLSVEDKVNEQPNTCNFSINIYSGQSYKPVVGEEVIITDENSLKIFAGNILSVRHYYSGKLITYEVECKDYTSELDRIQVIDSFDNQTVTQIINYINTNYLTGITTVNVDCPIIVKRVVFNRKSVTECLNSLVKLTNYIWYIDYDKDIHFIAKNTEVAPFSISDNSQNLIGDSLEISSDLSQLRNVVVVRGGEKVATNTRDKDHTTDGVMTIFNTDYKFANKPTVSFIGASGSKYKRTITIDNTKIDASLIDFPVLVKLTSSNFDFTKTNTDGSDVSFELADGTKLKFERERHDVVNQVAEYWVKIPSVSSSVDTEFIMLYGNSSATDQSDAPNVWDSDFSMVQHAKNNLSGLGITDSTSNNNDGIKHGANGPTQIETNEGYAQHYNGIDEYIEVADNNTLNPNSSPLTIETRVRTTLSGTAGGPIVYNKENLYEASLGGLYAQIAWQPNWAWVGGTSSPVNLNEWINLTIVYDKSYQRIYINGVETFSVALTGDIGTITSALRIGARGAPNTASSFFEGDIGEMRISLKSRNLSYIKATHSVLINTLITVGAEITTTPALTYLTVGIENLQTTGYDCYWDYNQKYIRFDVAPTSGQSLKITGNPLIPIIVQVENISSVSKYGRYEFSKVDKSLKSSDDARLYAQAELDSYGQSVREGGFSTYKSGLSSGQTITINLTDINIADNFIIQSVSLNMLSRTKGEYAVEVATTKTMGIIKFLRDKLLNTKNIELNENDVLEKYYTDYQDIKVNEEINILTQMADHTIINVGEDILKDPFGSGVYPEFVLAPYTPTGNTDIKREFVLDRSYLS